MVIFTFALLLLSFVVHVIWWRIKFPTQSSLTLLIIFLLVPMITVPMCYYLQWIVSISLAEIVSLVLLYLTSMLVYICIYSAIEQQSPTLSILAHINSHGIEGCESHCILHHVKPDEEITKRLSVMEQVGWLIDKNGYSILTQRGYRIAYFFKCGAIILGIEHGG